MAALCTTQEEAARIIRERQAGTGKPCRGATAFRNPKPHDDDSDGESCDDDGGGEASQLGIGYEVTFKCRTV